jgi:hypothetical protein
MSNKAPDSGELREKAKATRDKAEAVRKQSEHLVHSYQRMMKDIQDRPEVVERKQRRQRRPA